MNIQTLLAWYLTLQIFSVISLPLSFAWLRDLPSRGYAAAKALGLLLSGVLFWWGGILHIWPNTASAAVMVALMVLALGLWRMHGRWSEVPAWWQAHRTFVVTTEALFLIAFVLWVAVRATQPQLATAGGEKWMEIAFLNALQRSPSMPPHDPWLSGFAISYYYLGYLLLSMLTSVAGIPATIAFTLGNAAWFALAAVVAYGIVYDLLEGRQPFGPLLAPLLLLLTGNATGFLQLLYARGLLPAAFWRWLDIRGINTPPLPPARGSHRTNSTGGAPRAHSTTTRPSAPPPTPSARKSSTSSRPSASSWATCTRTCWPCPSSCWPSPWRLTSGAVKRMSSTFGEIKTWLPCAGPRAFDHGCPTRW